jgi:hypothetical protein
MWMRVLFYGALVGCSNVWGCCRSALFVAVSSATACAGDAAGITSGAAWRAALEAACEVGSQQVLLGELGVQPLCSCLLVCSKYIGISASARAACCGPCHYQDCTAPATILFCTLCSQVVPCLLLYLVTFITDRC